MGNACHEAAKQYLAAGLHPIPCLPRDKRPLVQWKEYQETPPTVEQIDAWWQQYPEANVGLVVGRGLMVVDVDGAEGWAALKAAGVEFPEDAPIVATGKGAHVYLAGQPVPNRVGVVPKVDVRSDGGFVVAPPSIHPTGSQYAWLRPLSRALPPAPPALTAMIARNEPAAAAGADWFVQSILGVAEGGRDQACTRLAGYLLGKNLPAETVDLILQRTFAAHCSPPFPADQVSKCVQSIAKRQGAADGPPLRIDELVSTAMNEILAPPEARKRPASTSLACIDEVLAGGVWPGEYVLLGARPSVGKTALALQTGRMLASKGIGVLIVSLEMTRTALTRRLLAQEACVRSTSLKTGDLTDTEKGLLHYAATRMSGYPIWITSDVRTTDQLSDALLQYPPGMLGMVIVDYLQLMQTAEPVRDARQRVEAVSKDLRRMTVKHELPFIVLSSLRRPNARGDEWRPTMADLRESGELEHDADHIWLMHRVLGQEETEFQVEKNRDGIAGGEPLRLRFNGSIQTFTEAN